MAQRTPISVSLRKSTVDSALLKEHERSASVTSAVSVGCSTPSATEGESATETDGPHTESDSGTENEGQTRSRRKIVRHGPTSSFSSTTSRGVDVPRDNDSPASQHDLIHRYFRKDVILLHHVDIFRYSVQLVVSPAPDLLNNLRSATDLQLVLVLTYVLLATFIPSLSHGATLALCTVHAFMWSMFHSFGLGLLLRAQSENKFLVRHFLKHYHYPRNDNGKGALYEAFSNWKSIYNMSMCMTYGEPEPYI